MQIPQPGTEKHRKLLDLVIRRLRASENALSGRHEAWRRSERSYRLYVDPQEIQGPQEAVTVESENLYVYPTSIVVPLSYAITQTLISFWMTLFTSDKPYFRINARDSDSRGPARAQELLISYQLDYLGYPAILYNWLLDSCRYGIGVVKNMWDVVEHTQTVRRFMDFPGPNGPIKIQVSDKKPVVEYEGNFVECIDPFTWRPDHRWPLNQFQRGSFCGEALYRSYFELLRQEGRGVYQNVTEVPGRSTEHFKESVSDRDRIMGTNQFFGLSFDNFHNDSLVLVEEVQVDLIPSDYDLAATSEVTRMVVTLANRSVIIRLDDFPYDHNDYTYATMESSPDTHSFMNPGIIEIMEPVHQHISWFMNSMIENARKSLNDRLVVDPDIVNMDDVLSPSAGKVIRVNERYWGVPGAAKNAVFQLPVQDIAMQNMKHVGFLMDMLQKVSAASDALQGQLAPEDRSATEISSASQQGAARLRALAKMFSTTGLQPLARQMVQNNMQLMTNETYMHIVGTDLEQEYAGVGRAVQGGAMIGPEDIQGLFSFPISDASQPLDPVRFARTWVQIMQVSLQNPALAQRVDFTKTWLEMVKAMGIPDPSRLLLPQQVQVMPDQQLQQQVQQGNLAPMPQQQPNGVGRNPVPQRQQPQSIPAEERRPMR